MRMTSSDALLQVVRLLGVEREDLPGDLALGHDERGDRLARRGAASPRGGGGRSASRSPSFGAVMAMIGIEEAPVLSMTSASRLWCVSERSRWNGVGSTLSIGSTARISGFPPSGSRYAASTAPPSFSIRSFISFSKSTSSTRHWRGSRPREPAAALRARFFGAARFRPLFAFFIVIAASGHPR